MAQFLSALRSIKQFLTLPWWEFHKYPSLRWFRYLHSEEGKAWMRQLEEDAKNKETLDS